MAISIKRWLPGSLRADGDYLSVLLEESLQQQETRAGEIITAEIVRIDQNFVVVNAGLKSESMIPVEEFQNDRGEIEVKAGDFVLVAIEMLESAYGIPRLSREKAKRIAAWNDLDRAMSEGALVKGLVTGKVKGGLSVMVNGIRAFLPGSLVDTRPVRDTTPYENREFEFKIIKLDRKRDNVVVSLRAVLEASMGEEHLKLLESLREGAVVKGIVRIITDYGAFVDLGGIDGLLHITDLAWRRVRHPSEVLNVGDEVTAKVLKFDQEKNRVSLGMKQLGEDPWVGIARRYPQGTRMFGKVTNLTDYGPFVEIEQGIEGLVHVSEMDWTNKDIHPTKVVQLGDEVEVMILEIDEDRRRISLGMKQCMANPWDDFAMNHKKGDRVKGAIKSITDFGIFIGLPGGIDGLVHPSDLSWSATGEEARQNFKKGDEVEAVVLSIDVDKERISLGVKQLDGDPFTSFVATHDKNHLEFGTNEILSRTPKTTGADLHTRLPELDKESFVEWRNAGNSVLVTKSPVALRAKNQLTIRDGPLASEDDLCSWLGLGQQSESFDIVSEARFVELVIPAGLTEEDMYRVFDIDLNHSLVLRSLVELDSDTPVFVAPIAIFPSGSVMSIGKIMEAKMGHITINIDDAWDLLDPGMEHVFQVATDHASSPALIAAVRY